MPTHRIGSPDLSIICVNWNSEDYLIECIRSIYDTTHNISFEIIVVDNASPHDDLRRTEARFPDVKLIRSAKNLGFAGANNLGFKHSTGSTILLLNPDTEILGNAIETMVAALKQAPDAGIVGCALLDPDLSTSIASVQKFPTILNQLLMTEDLVRRFPHCRLWDIGPILKKDSEPVKVEVIPGACMMLKREVYERAGMLSEDYFMYAEDIDLNYSVERLGMNRYYVSSAKIIHFGGRSSAKQPVNEWATWMQAQAMLRYFRKTRGAFYSMLYRGAICVTAVARIFLLALARIARGKDLTRRSFAKWSILFRWSLGITMQSHAK